MASGRSPTQYVESHRAQAQRLWRGELGEWQRSFGRRLAPAIPPVAWAGFGTNGDPNSPGGGAAFWEMGWAGITGGTTSLTPPSTDRSTENDYYDLHNDPRVVAVLGRPASMAPGGWRSLPDQTAVGIVSLIDHGRGTSQRLDERIRPARVGSPSEISSSAGSPWFTFLAFAGWSAGDGRAASHINQYADELAGVPEEYRPSALYYFVARDAASGGQMGPAGSHNNRAYTILRTWQKLASAGDLEPSSYFGLHGSTDWQWVESALTAAALGGALPTGAVPGWSAPKNYAKKAAIVLGLAAVLIACVSVWSDVHKSDVGIDRA